MLEIKKVENGLHLSIPDKEDRLELKEMLEHHHEVYIWDELFEPYSTNGSYSPLDPEQWYIGLTSDPYIIAECIDYLDDRGEQIRIYGDLYHCPGYMVESVVERLIEDGEYTLTKFYICDPNGEVLNHANLYHTNLSGATLHRADLSFADFSTANVSFADLSSADLSTAYVYRIKINYT